MGARGVLKLPKHLQPVADENAPTTAADVLPPVAPERPGDMSEAEAAIWDELCEALNTAGLLSTADGPALRLAIRHYLAAMAASTELLAGDAAVTDPHHDDRLAKHPANQVFRDQSKSFLAYAQQLGMTFVSRARTTMAGRNEPDGDAKPSPFSATGS